MFSGFVEAPLAQWHGGYGGMGPGGVVFIRWLVKSGDSSRSSDRVQAQSGDAALDILRKRYARGEIDSEEFQQRKRALTED
jgi:uncharacterized membrane protein